MAFWGKRKQEMPLEDFWVANIGEALQPGNRELFETDIFYVLFPEARIKAEGGKAHYLKKEGIPFEHFIAFTRVLHLSACCACAYIDNRGELPRFMHLESSKMGSALRADFEAKGLKFEILLTVVHRSFLGQDIGNIESWMKNGSETFGLFEEQQEIQKKILIQANVLYNFLVQYCSERAPLFASILQRNPSASRDSVASVIATTKRLHDHTRESFTTV